MGMSTVGSVADQMNFPGYGDEQASQELGRPVGIGQPGQMANNPIYGQFSPFQEQPIIEGQAPVPTQYENTGFFGGGKSMPGIGLPQFGGPAPMPGQQPLQGTPMMPNQQASQELGRPVGIGQPGQQFMGGLRPAPRGYRPPMRRGFRR